MFIYLKGKVCVCERNRGRHLRSTYPLPRWLQCLGLCQAKARSLGLLSGLLHGLGSGFRNPKTWGPSSTAFQGTLIGSWIRSEIAGTQTHASIGCQHLRQSDFLLCHGTTTTLTPSPSVSYVGIWLGVWSYHDCRTHVCGRIFLPELIRNLLSNGLLGWVRHWALRLLAPCIQVLKTTRVTSGLGGYLQPMQWEGKARTHHSPPQEHRRDVSSGTTCSLSGLSSTGILSGTGFFLLIF